MLNVRGLTTLADLSTFFVCGFSSLQRYSSIRPGYILERRAGEKTIQLSPYAQPPMIGLFYRDAL